MILVNAYTIEQFPVDVFSHPVMPSLVVLLHKFSAFAYNEINCFLFVTT